MDDEQIKHMVDRFLCWPVPSGWSPDGGISYTPWINLASGTEDPATGTNLFDANQTEAMVRHMVEGLPAMTKQISRDDVMRVCESLCSPDVCCPCRDFRHDTAAMLRSLWDELAAANERADEIEARTMVFSNHLEIAGYTKFATDLRKAIAGGD